MKLNSAFFGSCIFAALAFGAIGCAGNGSNPGEVEGTIYVAGGSSHSELVTVADIPASTSSQTVVIGDKTVIIPPTSEAIPAGTSLAIISEGSVLFAGISPGTALSRAPGDITLTNLDNPSLSTTLTGAARFELNGLKLTRNVAIPSGNWDASIEGPLVFSQSFDGGTSGNALNIGKVNVKFTARNAVTSFPLVITAVMPANGGTTGIQTSGAKALATITAPSAYFGTKATLTLGLSDSNSISRTQKFAYNGVATAVGFMSYSNAGTRIPSTGLKYLTLDVTGKF